MDPILSPASGSWGWKRDGEQRDQCQKCFCRETGPLTESRGSSGSPTAAVGCEMVLELKSSKGLGTQTNHTGRKAQHMNQAQMPLCHCALSPRQAHGNTDYGTFLPSGLAGPAFLGRVVAGRWTAPLLWLRYSDMFAISSFLELFLGDSVGPFLPLNFLAFH